MYRIVYSESTISDLQEITNFISKDNPFYAKKVIDQIYTSIELLETLPLIGKEGKDGLRELIEPDHKFRVLYVIDFSKKEIGIVAIFKHKNDWK